MTSTATIPKGTKHHNVDAPSTPSTPRAFRSRHIPQATRDLVFARDGERCTYVGPDGHRCDATHDLQIDHVVPFARGGSHAPENLRLLCGTHNRRRVERAAGAGWRLDGGNPPERNGGKVSEIDRGLAWKVTREFRGGTPSGRRELVGVGSMAAVTRSPERESARDAIGSGGPGIQAGTPVRDTGLEQRPRPAAPSQGGRPTADPHRPRPTDRSHLPRRRREVGS